MKSMKFFWKLKLLVAFLVIPMYVQAQNTTDFIIYNVEVNLPAGDVTKLRLQAVDKAVRNAFIELLRNITPKEVWSRHNAIAEIVNFDKVMEKFTIVEEVTVPNYHLILDVSFIETAVKKELANLNVPFSEAKGGKILVIPLLEIQNMTYLWQPSNPWKEALLNESGSATFFQFVLPTGDETEIRLLTPEMAQFGAGDILMKLANNYGASGAVVAKAKVVHSFDGRFLEIENLWYGENNFAPAIVSIPLLDDITFEESLSKAARHAMEEMTEYWRSSSIVQVDRPGRVFLRYQPSGPTDLEKLKKHVSSMSVVKKLTLRVLNIRDSVFQVDFYGDKSDIWDRLHQAGLTVNTTDMNMIWAVSFPDQKNRANVEEIN